MKGVWTANDYSYSIMVRGQGDLYTVYGLGANGLDGEAVAKIFEAKGRPNDNPLILHVAKKSDVTKLWAHVPKIANVLMDTFWPGPLTLIFTISL